jgi:hypothetical protein
MFIETESDKTFSAPEERYVTVTTKHFARPELSKFLCVLLVYKH